MAQLILARRCLIFRTRRYGAAPGQTAFDPLADILVASIQRQRLNVLDAAISYKSLSFPMAAGYCGSSAPIKFDDEQFAALFNELQPRGDKTKLMQLFGA